MKKLLFIIGCVFFITSQMSAQDCLTTAKVIKPNLSEKARNVYETKMAEAKSDFQKAQTADTFVWLGRRTAYVGNYKEAIGIYTNAIKKYPNDARFYRHRGHRYLSIRCFDDAIKDFKQAAKLIKGNADVVEPDGLPNARNIPTSTLQSNIWYHLGLAYYIKGDFKNARKAYKNCLKVSKNADMLVATTNWLYITLHRLNKTEEAEKSLKPITDDLDIIENGSYYRLLKLYQGKINAEDLLNEIGSHTDDLNNASIGYGLGNWFLINNETEKAENLFRQITAGNQWSSFGYVAAEAELTRLN